MLRRRLLWFTVGALVVGVLVCGGALAVWVLRGREAPAALLVVGGNDRLRLIDERGAERLLDSGVQSAEFDFPAVSADGRRLAYVVSEQGARVLYCRDLPGGERRELLRTSVRRPFNLTWSPDGRYISFLAIDGESLIAQIVPADGSQAARLVTSGTHIFFSWSPDGRTLLLHTNDHAAQGGQIELYDTAAGHSSSILSDPGLFQAPAWTLDGKQFFYAAQPPTERMSYSALESSVVRVGQDGRAPSVLASEKHAGLRIVRAPGSDRLAYIVQEIAEDGTFAWGPLKLIEGGGAAPRTLSRAGEQISAFFWSPDGAQIAYLTYTGGFTPRGRRTWHVVDLASGAVRDLGTFTPSAEFANFQYYFDAYLHTLSLWSPDSRRLTYGAHDGVYVIDLASGGSSRVADGALGMWTGGR
jgi:TolB protein